MQEEKMEIKKSEGLTKTEKYLAKLCERTFLKLWSFPNPTKDDGHELCDLIAVFDNNVFIFFDRNNNSLFNESKDFKTNWEKWKRKSIRDQLKTAHGAERYIRSNRDFYIDNKRKILFPINFNREKSRIFKIIIAHGAKEKCEEYSEQNESGSLAIIYENIAADINAPFFIKLDRDKPVHVFDSNSVEIIFNELDTFFDFKEYLIAKEDALKKYNLTYCGEEDLLAHYYYNFDEKRNKHFIGYHEKNINMLMIGEGEWKDFIKSDTYKYKKEKDRISYFWDELIQKTTNNALNGKLLGDSDLFNNKSAIFEMAKEPRFHRRELSKDMIEKIEKFPTNKAEIFRYITFMPSFYKNMGYVFLQFMINDGKSTIEEKREIRQKILEIACGVAKNKFEYLKYVVGIAMEPPKICKNISEDFLLLDCTSWKNKERNYYEIANMDLKIFESDQVKIRKKRVKEFPERSKKNGKIGRNDLCPCGSGKKYKYCCLK